MSHIVCVVLPHLVEKDGHPERQWVLRKLCEGLSTKKHWVLENGLFLFPLSSFPLESRAFAVGAGGPTLPCPALFHTGSSCTHPLFSFHFFVWLSRMGIC